MISQPAVCATETRKMATQESAASPEAVGNGEVKMNDTDRTHFYISLKNAAVQISTES